MQNNAHLNIVGTCLGGLSTISTTPVESPLKYCDSFLLNNLKKLWEKHFTTEMPSASFGEFLQVIAKRSSKLGCGACSHSKNILGSNRAVYIDWAVQHVLAGKGESYVKAFTEALINLIEDQSTQATQTKSKFANAYVSQRMTGIGNWETVDLKNLPKMVLFDTNIMSACMKCKFRQEEHLVSLFDKVQEYSEIFTA